MVDSIVTQISLEQGHLFWGDYKKRLPKPGSISSFSLPLSLSHSLSLSLSLNL